MSRTRNPELQAEASVLLLISQEPLLLLEAEKELKGRLVPGDEQDLNFLMLFGWEAKVSQVMEFLQTMPFLGHRRLLVIREVQKFEGWKEIVPYLEDPNPTSTLLMTSSELKKSGAQYKSLSRHAQVVEKRRPYGRALVKWVAGRFASAGKSVDLQLAELLIQIAGEDLGILATEIEKVVVAAGEDQTIGEKHLSVSVPGGVDVVFNFLDALAEGRSSRAMTSLRALLRGDSPPEYLVHMMAWHYRQLLKGRDLVDSGLSPSEAAVRMGKKYPGLKEKFARQVGRANERDLVRAMEALADCDRELKSGRVPSGTLLDKLVLELLA